MGSGSNNDDSLAKLMGGPANGGSITQWFDAILAAIQDRVTRGTVPTYAPPPPPPNPNDQAISEIERQLFLQFLMGELQFMKTHRIMKAKNLFIHIEHDRIVCEKRQQQISDALSKLGNDGATKAILNSERGRTIAAFVAMELQEKEGAFLGSLDDFLDNREEGIVKRILAGLLDDYSREQASDFDAHFAWKDLQGRWASWAASRPKRGQALRKLWAATGGGKDLNSADPEAYSALRDYYKSIYEQLDAGGIAAAMVLINMSNN